MLVKKPTEILKHAVKGMLAKNNLAKDQLAKLLVGVQNILNLHFIKKNYAFV